MRATKTKANQSTETSQRPGSDHRGHPGGDTTAAACGNRTAISAYLAKLKKNKVALPANPQRPKRVSMTEVAREAGIETFALLRRRSKLRQLVEAAEPGLGVGVRLRQVKDSELRLVDLEKAAIARRRKENDEQGYPTEQGVKELRQLLHAVARLEPDHMRAPATPALDRARAALAAGQLKLTRALARQLEDISRYLKELEASDGLPQDFAGALSVACACFGLTITELARRAGVPTQTVVNWAAGRRNPDRRSNHVVRKIEDLLGLERDVLVSRIRRMRAGQGRMPADLFPENLRSPEHRRERSAISRLLPEDARFMPEQERYRAIDTAIAELESAAKLRRRRGACLKARYALKKFPTHLEEQWCRLKRHKQSAVAAPGVKNGILWSSGSASIWRQRCAMAFGFALLSEAGAYRTQPNKLGFEMIADPDFAQAYLAFKADRSRLGLEDTPADALVAAQGKRLTSTDLDLLTQWASFFRRNGWIRHDREMRKLLGYARKNDDDWEGYCARIAEKYRELEKDMRDKYKRPIADHSAFAPILDMPEPMTAIKLLIDGLGADLAGTHESKSPPVLQDLVWTLLQAQAPLRPGAWAYVEIKHLKRDAQGWRLEIPREPFKNRNSKYFALHKDFCRRLKDEWGLYEHLERFLKWGRPLLLDDPDYPRLKRECPYLFIYGRKYLAQQIEAGNDRSRAALFGERENGREQALATRVRAFTARHLGYDAAAGTGIKGITALSPTAFRHIVATSLIKRYPRHPQIAADAIADSVEVTLTTYARYLPEDRCPQMETAMAESMQAAAQAARDIVASWRRRRPATTTPSRGGIARSKARRNLSRLGRRRQGWRGKVYPMARGVRRRRSTR